MKKSFRIIALASLFLIPDGIRTLSPIGDVIGFLMITAALSKLSRLEERIFEARRRFLILTGVAGARYVLSVVYPDLSQTTTLLFALCFAVAETILVLPAFANLLSGTEYLLARHSEKSCSAVTAGLKKLTTATFIIKALALFLPLLPQLSGREGSTVYGNEESAFSDFTNLYFIFAGIVLLAVGLPWAIKFIKAYFRISGDGDFLKSIRGKYEKEVLAFPEKVAAAKTRTATAFIIAGGAFLFNFYIDNVNLFPNFISAVLFAVGIIYLDGAVWKWRIAGIVSAVLWGIAAFVGTKLQIGFNNENYNVGSVLHNIGKSAKMYHEIEIFSYIEAAMFALCAAVLLICLKKSLVKRLGFSINYAESYRAVKPSMITFELFLWTAVLINAVQTTVMKYYPLVWMVNGVFIAALVVSAYRMSTALHEKL